MQNVNILLFVRSLSTSLRLCS